MNKFAKNIVALSLFSVAAPSLAINGGTNVDNNDFQHIVEMNCTGTLISGKYVLTAAHCAVNNGMRNVTMYDGTSVETAVQYEHPDYNLQSVDVGIWELSQKQLVNQTGFIDPSVIPDLEPLTIYGFGGTAPQLKYAKQVARPIGYNSSVPAAVTMHFTNEGHTAGGDSGGPYVDNNGMVKAVHTTYDGSDARDAVGARLEYARDFILGIVNGWNYPTNIKVNNTQTITIQSLHVNSVVDSSYTEGDVEIHGQYSSCRDRAQNPYESCTLQVSSGGNPGKIYLTANDVIEVNKSTTSSDDNNHDNGSGGTSGSGSGGGGGSLGLISLLGLGLLNLRKRK